MPFRNVYFTFTNASKIIMYIYEDMISVKNTVYSVNVFKECVCVCVTGVFHPLLSQIHDVCVCCC